ncbi:MAG: MFS transporter [Phycisphaerales bacterium]
MTGERITKTQWKALIAAWLGWCFDGLDGYLYVMVATDFVRQLLENDYGVGNVPPGEVKGTAALIQAVFLIGWAVGGAVFGRIGDRLGRSRTLTLTVLTYAIFTGLSFFATSWWHLLIFRFIAALGIGGEWAAGSALVAEVLPARHRFWASAALQSGYMVGCMMACLAPWAVAAGNERWVFLVGVLPAFLTLWIRSAVPEPENWSRAVATQAAPSMLELFRGQLLRITLLTTALTSIALTTVWSFLFFVPQLISTLDGVTKESAPRFKALVTIWYLAVNIGANFFACWLARRLGHRRAFFIMMLGALAVFTVGFGHQYGLGPRITSSNIWAVTGFTAFFALGLFGMFPMYIPCLFPTLVRTMGAGFTYNVGRLFSAAGAFYGGMLTQTLGYEGAVFWTGLLYLPGLLLAPFLPIANARDAEEPAR